MQYKSVLDKVLQEIKPTKKPAIISKTVKEINEALWEHKIKANAMVGGSFAKDTHLAGHSDVDIFVQFNIHHYKGHALSPLLQEALEKFEVRTIHGSRDYFQFEREGISFEVVPVLGIKKSEDADNLMDYSPLHVTWVQKHIGTLQDDIRLAKQFCKAAGVYGAESYIRGFSGHTLDILVIHHKGFIPLLESAKGWGEKVVIDFDNYHKGKALEVMNAAKIQSPLIVVDPIFHERNAAANLDDAKFQTFKEHAKRFLDNPSEKFFVEKKIDLAALEKKGAVILEFTPIKGEKDVVGSKLLKVFGFVKKGFKDFGVVDCGWEWKYGETAKMWYLLEKKELKPTFVQEGPPLSYKPFVVAFKEKHEKTFEKDDKIHAEVKRECTTVERCLKLLFKDSYVKERAKKSKVLAL